MMRSLQLSIPAKHCEPSVFRAVFNSPETLSVPMYRKNQNRTDVHHNGTGEP